MNPRELFAANMRSFRKRLGLTQTQAGARIGWTQQQWGIYESGEKSPGIEVLFDIARALETTPSMLVDTTIQHEQKAEPKKLHTERRGQKQGASG